MVKQKGGNTDKNSENEEERVGDNPNEQKNA